MPLKEILKENLADRLIWACRNNNVDAAKHYLIEGANIHAFNDAALQTAARYGCLDAVKFLISAGANIHARNNNALHLAVYFEHIDVVKHLIDQGADIRVDYDRELRQAAHLRNIDIVNHLRQVAGSKYKCHRCLIKSTCMELCKDFRVEK